MTTKPELITWLRSGKANRVILVEVQGVLKEDGSTTAIYLSNKPFTSRGTDNPSNTSYTAAISGGITFSESLSLDGQPNIGFGDIQLDNRNNITGGDTWFRWVWTNKPVNILIGDASWARADFYTIFTGLIRDIDTSGRNSVNLLLVNRLEKLNLSISEAVVGGTGTNKDQLIPLTFGECFNVTPILVDPATLTYQVHNGPIEDIIEVRDNGAPLTGTSAPIKDLANGKFRLSANPFGTITASVQGYKKAGTTYQSKVGSVISSILLDYVTVTSTYSLSASASSINEGQSVTFTLYTTDIPNGTLVPYTITGVTSADLGGASLTGNFTVSGNQATLTLTASADLTTEGNETITVSLTGVAGVSASVLIVDTSQTAAATITVNSTTPVEGDQLTFSITPNYSGTVWWRFTAVQGTVDATDFVGGVISGSFTGTAGIATQIQTTLIIVDTYPETPVNIFRLDASTTSGGASIGSSPNITITDAAVAVTPSTATSINETSGTNSVTFSITPNYIGNVYWEIVQVSGTINAGDFSDANGLSGTINNTTKGSTTNIIKTLAADTSTEGTETFRLDVRAGSSTGPLLNSSGIVTVTDSSVSSTSFTTAPTTINEGVSTTYTINTTETGTLVYVVVPGTGVTSADFSTPLTASIAGSSGSRSFTITTVNDIVKEGNETFTIEIRRTNSTGTLLVTSSTITIVDTSYVELVNPVTTITEGTAQTYTVNTGSQYSNTLLYWTILTSGYTAVAGDFSATGGSFTMSTVAAGGTATATFNITALSDADANGETFAIVISTAASGGGTVLYTSPTITINNAAAASATVTANLASPQPEGTLVTFTIATTNVASGATLWYSITGTGITAGDFLDNTLEASFTLSGTSGTVAKTIRIDYPTDAESFTFSVSQTQGGASIGSMNFSITDVAALRFNFDIGQSGTASSWPNLVTGTGITTTIANGVKYVAGSPATSSYYNFDGVDDYITVDNLANSNYTLSSGFSFSAWFMPFTSGEGMAISTGNGGYGRILDKSAGASSSGTPTSGFALRMNAAQDVSFQIGGGSIVASTGNQVPYGQWTHLIVTVSSSGTVNIYKNGNSTPIATGTTSATSTITTNNALTIGNRSGGTQDSTFAGNITVVKFFTTVLTAADVATEYALLSPRYPITDNVYTTGLVLHADSKNYISNGSTTWPDISGNSRNLTLFNGANIAPISYNASNAGVFSWVGNSINYSGDSYLQYAQVTSGTLDNGTLFGRNGTNTASMEGWFRFQRKNLSIINNGQINYQHLLGVRDETDFDMYLMVLDTDPAVGTYSLESRIRTTGGTAYTNYSTISTYADTWIHLAMVFNGTTATIYINGSVLGTITGIANNFGANTGKFRVGATDVFSGGFGLKGFTSIVRVYNAALTQAQVQQNYNAQRARFGV